jgi:mono/diheme cytochrome c family protein
MTRVSLPILSRWLTLRAVPPGLVVLVWAWFATAPRAADKSATAPVAPVTVFTQVVRPFLAKHCVSCHGPMKQSGSLALHDKSADSVQDDRPMWESMLEKLKASEMPPPKKPQPTADEKKAVVAWIEAALAQSKCTGPVDPGRVTLRRLNRAEYNNTIRDLLGLDVQPAEDFPADDVGYGFDNIGDVLALSPLLLEKYLAAAEKIVEKAFAGELPPIPPTKRWFSFELKVSQKDPPAKERGRALSSEGDFSISHNFPKDGDYAIRFRGYGQQVGGERVRYAVRLDGDEVRRGEVRASEPRFPTTQELRTRVKAGEHQVAIAFLNPYSDPKIDDAQKRDRQLVVQGVEIQGPLLDMVRLPTEAYKRILVAQPGPGLSDREAARRIVENLTRKAFRRPPTADEVERFIKLYELAREQGDDFEKGIQLAVQAILVSPHFLFKVEHDRPTPNPPPTGGGGQGGRPFPISEFELATRLSYFLWSSMPDDELLRLAERGQLRKELEPQVRRMMTDPKVRALGANFAGQWLQIRNLQSINPDPKQFPKFDEALRSAMIRETELFFEAMVKEDRNILDFLDADFTFVNERLAKHYGISGVRGEEFRRVSLKGTPRAGILTQASILTVTSNPTRTSPVKRGKFILESLLNAPPPPPPPDVPELTEEPQAILSGSLRQRMELHRTKPDCAVCHAKMDALGFAFENFDAVGAWRAKDGSFPIDPSGTLPDGRSFKDPAELRAILRGNHEQFRRCLVEKMLTYALGRGVENADRCAVDKVCEQVAGRQDRFSGLVLAVVQSEPFQMRTPSTGGGSTK